MCLVARSLSHFASIAIWFFYIELPRCGPAWLAADHLENVGFKVGAPRQWLGNANVDSV